VISRRKRLSGTYEGFTHDPVWFKMPEPGYLEGTIADLRRLPQFLQDDAVLVDACEASWSRHLVGDALNALADLGCGLRHLYRLVHDADGRPTGSQQIENAGSLDEEVTRRRMLDSLVHLPDGERGYIIWEVKGLESSERA
jgi:hypothetical protein